VGTALRAFAHPTLRSRSRFRGAVRLGYEASWSAESHGFGAPMWMKRIT